MSQNDRLADGGRIDRATPLTFTFNGTRYEGYHGRHARLRAARERRALRRAQLEIPPAARHRRRRASKSRTRSCSSKPAPHTVPNARATEVELYEGLVATSVNAWPSVENDRMAVTGKFARFIPAGFYYKTFMWPRKLLAEVRSS